MVLPPGGGADETAREARWARLMRAWWVDERPDWVGADWWDAPMRDEVRGLLWLGAGPVLAGALDAITTPDSCPEPHLGEATPGWPTPGHATGWPCACQVVLAAAWEACAAWVAARSAAAVVQAAGPAEVAFAPPAPAPRINDPAREELAVALRTSPSSMGNRIAAARDLLKHHELHGLVETAAISAWAARVVILEVAGLSEEVASTVVAEVVSRVRGRLAGGRRHWTSAEIGRVTRTIRLRLASDQEQSIRQRARADRKVHVFPDRNGMAVLHALIDATDAHRIHRRLSAIAQGLEDPDRTRDQVRADTLVDLLLGSLAQPSADNSDLSATDLPGGSGSGSLDPSGGGPGIDSAGGSTCGSCDGAEGGSSPTPPAGVGGVRADINVIVSLATLLGMSDQPACVPGLGPIPADVARDLAADGRWRAWITDAAGATITATGTRGYVPSEGLARLVRAREAHCRMPGCRRAADACDLDHAIPWPRGQTTEANLGPLCRRHHVLKTHAGWDLTPGRDPASRPDLGQSPEDANPGWTWRTPAGFTVQDETEPSWVPAVAALDFARSTPPT